MATKKISYRGMICESQVFANITSGFQKVCESACATTTQKVDECGDQTAIAEDCVKKVSRPSWLKEDDQATDQTAGQTTDANGQTQNPADQTTDVGDQTADANANTETPAPTVVNGSEGDAVTEDKKWDGDYRDAKGQKMGHRASTRDGNTDPDAFYLHGSDPWISSKSENIRQKLRQNKSDNQEAFKDAVKDGNKRFLAEGSKKRFTSLFKNDDCADGKCEKNGKLSDLVNESKIKGDKKAYISRDGDGPCPVRVDFPKSIGHYKTIEDAMTDIKLFGCEPVFDEGNKAHSRSTVMESKKNTTLAERNRIIELAKISRTEDDFVESVSSFLATKTEPTTVLSGFNKSLSEIYSKNHVVTEGRRQRRGKTFGYAPIVAPLAPEGGGGEGGCCMCESCCGDKKIVKEGALNAASGAMIGGKVAGPVGAVIGAGIGGAIDEADEANEDKGDDAKKAALAKHFDVKPEEVTYNGYTYEVDGTEWKVFTEEEAEKAARDYIREALWAFNADFILNHCATCKDMSDNEREETKKALSELTGKLCESGNGIVLALIGGEAGLEEFCEDAISADGRANFLGNYDGKEVELGDGFLAYKM